MSGTDRKHGGLLSVALVAGLAFAAGARGQDCDECKEKPCPPKFLYIFEGPPRIKFKHGCPRPICNPCDLPHYGYFATCWHPWPWPPDFSHCPVPPPGSFLPFDTPKRLPGEPPAKPEDKGPMPRSTEQKPEQQAPPESGRPVPASATEPSPWPSSLS